jgi:hypothetical protein
MRLKTHSICASAGGQSTQPMRRPSTAGINHSAPRNVAGAELDGGYAPALPWEPMPDGPATRKSAMMGSHGAGHGNLG